jgi:hypothetical protein
MAVRVLRLIQRQLHERVGASCRLSDVIMFSSYSRSISVKSLNGKWPESREQEGHGMPYPS